MMRSLQALIWRNLSAHKLRSILTTMAIALSVAMVLAATIIGQATNRSASALSEQESQADLQAFARSGARLEPAHLDTLRTWPDVEIASPILRVTVQGVKPEIGDLPLLGIEPEGYLAIYAPQLANGTFLDRPQSIVLPMAVAIDRGLNVGDEITLAAADRRVTLQVSGRLKLEQDMADLGQEQVAYVPLQVAQALNGTVGQIDQVDIQLRPGKNPDRVREALARQLGPDIAITRAQASRSVGFDALLVQGGLAMAGIVILFSAGFVILNAFTMSIAARTRQIGALRALGVTRRQVLWQVLGEAGFLGLSGVLSGLLGGVGLAWGVMYAMGLLDDLPFVVPWWGVALGVALGLGVTLLGALLPALRASSVPPLVAVQARRVQTGQSGYVRYGGRSGLAILIVLFVALGFFSLTYQPDFLTSTVVTIVGQVGLLVAALLILPSIVAPVARLARPFLIRHLGTAGRLAADNMCRNRLRTALTAAALTATLTTIIATSGLLTSTLKSGLHGFGRFYNEDILIAPNILGLVQSGELSIQKATERLTTAAVIDPALLDQVKAFAEKNNLELERIGFAAIPSELHPYPGTPGVFVDPEMFLRIGNFDFFQGQADQALEWMQRGRAMLVQPIVAERLGLSVGDTLLLDTLQGEVEFTVAGIGGNGYSFTVFPYADGETYFGMIGPSWLGMTVPDKDDVPSILTQVQALIAPDPGVAAVQVAEAFYRDMFKILDQLQALINGLLVLAVIIASLGVINTMAINVVERRRELALLRAVGATQRQVRQAVVAEAATMGLMAALIAAGLGLLMMALFALVMTPGGTESLGIRIDWEIVRIMLQTNGLALGIASALSLVFGPLIAALAAYFPARQAAALDVVEATRSERVTLKPAGARRPEHRAARKRWGTLGLSWTLAWHSLQQHSTRTLLSALAVTMGTGVIIAAGQFSESILDLGAEENLMASFIDTMGLILSAAGAVILAAAGFLIFNAFAMAVTQRKQQIGMLRALGMTRRQVLQQLLAEASITGGLGTALGLAGGPLLGWGLLWVMKSLGVEVGQGNVALGSVVLAVSMGLGVTLLSVMIPAWRATRLSPMVALQQTKASPVEARHAAPRLWIGVCIFTVLLTFLIFFPPGRWAGRYTPLEWLMCLLLTVPWLAALGLALPAIIAGTRHVAQAVLARVWGATGRLIAENLGRDRRRVILTVLSFAVGLATISMMNGFLTFSNEFLMRTAARGTLAQTSWFVYPFDRLSGVAQIDEFSNAMTRISPTVQQDVAQLVEGRARMAEIYMVSVPGISSPLPGFPSLITDIEWLKRPGMYTFVEGNWDTASAIMRSGCGVLITQSAAVRNRAGVGDEIVVQGKDGLVSCTVAGIGYGNTIPMALIGLAAKDAFVEGAPSSLLVWPTDDTDILALEADLRALAERHDDAWLTTPGQELQGVIDTSDQLEAIMNGLLALAVLAAALGTINTTMMSVTERRRELGLLRSVGATRHQVMAVVCGEAALMGLLGGVLGMVAGAGLTAIMCLSLGGIPFGMVDLDPWQGLAQSIPSALLSGIIGIISMPFIAAGAAWWPSRSVLRGTAIDTLHPRRGLESTARIRRKPPMRSLSFMALRNLYQHRTRTLLSVLAITLGTATIVATGVTNAGVRSAVGETVEEAVAFVTDMVGVGLNIAGGMILLAAGVLILNAFGMAVTQQRQQIGALRSLGMTRRQVMGQVLIEAMSTGGLGVLLGIATGPLMGKGILLAMRTSGYEVGAGSTPWGSLVLAAAVGLGVTLLSALLPAWRATHISPLRALQPQRAAGIERTSPARTVTALCIIAALAAYLIAAPPGKWTVDPWNYALPFALLVPWFGALLLLTPSLIGWMGRRLRAPLTRLWKASGTLIGDNLRRGRGRVTLTLLTFAVGIATITGVTGVFTFFGRELPTFAQETRFRNGLLPGWAIGAGDLTKGVMDAGGMVGELRPEVVQAVYKVTAGRATVGVEYPVIIPEISAVLVPSYFSIMLDPKLIAVPGNVRFIEGDLETALPVMESGCGLLLAPGAAARNEVGVGDTMTIQSRGGPLDCTVAGVVAMGMVPVSVISPAVKDHFDVGQPTSILIFSNAGTDREALEADLRAIDEKYGTDAWLTSFEESVNTVAESTDLVLSLMSSLLLLATLAAALGAINTMVINVTERRRELGLFRAVGATRRQVMAVVCGEAALIGLLGGLLGVIAGAGFSVIFTVTHGGNAWGYPDIDLWQAAWHSLRPALANGLLGLATAPLLSSIAAWLPARAILRGSTIETMEPARQKRALPGPTARVLGWGNLRTRFVLGTALLIAIVLGALVTVVTTHARLRMEEQTHDALRALVAWSAEMIELETPPDAEQLDLDDLQSEGAFGFDPDTLLQFEALIDDMTENGLHEFLIADRDNVVLISLDMRDIGTTLPDLQEPEQPAVRSERTRDEWWMQATAPIQNQAGTTIGSIRLQVDAQPIRDFLDRLRNTLILVGAGLLLVALGASWSIAGWMAKRPRPSPGSGTAGRLTLDRIWPTVVMGLMVALLVGALQLVTIPIERRQVETRLQDGLIAAAEWMGQVTTANPELEQAAFSLDTLLQTTQTFDLARLQAVSEQLQTSDTAFIALSDQDGTVLLSDQMAMIGETIGKSPDTQIKEQTWRDEPVWVISTPLVDRQEGEQIGTLHIAVRRERVETFLDESRSLFRLSGIIALLGGTLLAQVIGAAVTTPPEQVETRIRQAFRKQPIIAGATATTRGNVRDELSILTKTFDHMVIALREREWLREMFGRFVSRQVAEAIRSGQVRLEGEHRVVSVLFCNIENFGVLSAQHTPEELVATLNEYLPLVVQAAQQHAGTVNKFGGDSTLIIYGAPNALQESAYHALRTALQIRASLEELNTHLARRGAPPLQISIGINTGIALAGAVGPQERQEYTVIGDSVNLASRIEALGQLYPDHDILISQDTYHALGTRRNEFALTSLGTVQIRGKKDPVQIWAVP